MKFGGLVISDESFVRIYHDETNVKPLNKPLEDQTDGEANNLESAHPQSIPQRHGA